MLDLRTRTGRRAAAAVLAVALTMIACDTDSPTAPTTDDVAPADTGNTDSTDTDDETTSEVEADEATDEEIAMAIALAGLEYDSCHDYNSAGGNSDGVFAFSIPDAPDGAAVEVDVTLQDGSQSETLTGTVQDGRVTVLAPLNSFGEVVEVVAIRVDGEALDLSGLGSTEFTVAPESECGNHPEVAAN